MASIDELSEQQINNSPTGGRLKETQFKLEDGESAIVKFDPNSFATCWESWIVPSNNIPEDKKGEDVPFSFRLKNDREYSPFAGYIGSPASWQVNDKYKKPFTNLFKGGIFEFKYSDYRNKKGFKERIYKYVHNPEYKDFFRDFAFQGEDFDMDDYPKAEPKLKYYSAVLIDGNKEMEDSGTLRTFVFSNQFWQALLEFHREDYDIRDNWFKIKRSGTGIDTEYKIFPEIQLREQLDQTYDLKEYKDPGIEDMTNVSSSRYLWKYLQDHIQTLEGILGLGIADKIQEEYESTKHEDDDSDGGSFENEDSDFVPSKVKEGSDEDSGGYSDEDDSEAIPELNNSDMSDEDIPF